MRCAAGASASAGEHAAIERAYWAGSGLRCARDASTFAGVNSAPIVPRPRTAAMLRCVTILLTAFVLFAPPTAGATDDVNAPDAKPAAPPTVQPASESIC